MSTLTKNSSLIIVFALIVLTLTGCGKKTEVYGETIPTGQATSIGDVLTKPRDFADKIIILEGTITEECPTGCWFIIKQGNAEIFVTIEGRGLAIPQHIGRDVRVQGKVEELSGRISLVGTGVEIK